MPISRASKSNSLLRVAGSGPKPLALEPRFMYDGAAAASAVHAHVHDIWRQAEHDPSAALTAGWKADLSGATSPANVETPLREAATGSQASQAAQTTATHAIAFVDTNVTNWQELVAGISPGIQVVLLNSNENGITQMLDALQGQHDLSAIYIVGHGADGAAEIGDTVLTAANLNSYEAQLAQIGASLAPGGSLLLYGCDIAEGSAGATFVTDLGQLTHTTVAASTDATGSAADGGDWTLEYATGAVTAEPLLTAKGEADFQGLLEAPVVDSVILQTPNYSETNADSVTYLVTFSEAVQGVTGDSFTFTSDSVTGATVQLVTAVAGSNGTQYEVTVGNLAGLSGSLTLAVSQEGYASITSTDGTNTALINNGLLVEGSSNDQTYDLAHTINTPVITGLLNSSGAQGDSGASSSDFVTDVNQLQFTGTADAGDTVVVTLDGKIIGSVTATATSGTTNGIANGVWTFNDSATTIADGVHTLQVTAYDQAGNIAQSSSVALTVDTAAPTLSSSSSVAGAIVTLNFADAQGVNLETGTAPAAAAFTVTDVTTNTSYTATYVQINANGSIQLELSGAVAASDALTVSYNASNAGAAPLTDLAGNPVASFSGTAITNSTGTDTGVTISGIGVPNWYDLGGAATPVFQTQESATAAGATTQELGAENELAAPTQDLQIDVDGAYNANALLTSATVTLTGGETGDTLAIATALPTGLSASYSYSGSTGTLTITGIASASTYEAVLNEVTFSTTSTTVTNYGSSGYTGQRSISLSVTDGYLHSSSTVAPSVATMTTGAGIDDAGGSGTGDTAVSLGDYSITMNVLGQSWGTGQSTDGYLVVSSDIYTVNLVLGTVTETATTTASSGNDSTSLSLNGMGFNPITGMLYASNNEATKGQVVAINDIGSDDTATGLGEAYGSTNAVSSSSIAADIGADGIMYLYNSSTIYRLDLNPTSPYYLQYLKPITVSGSFTPGDDIAISPVNGNIYSATTGVVYEITRLTTSDTWTGVEVGTVTVPTEDSAGNAITNSGTYAMQYFDMQGDLLVTNGSGTYWKNDGADDLGLIEINLESGPTTTSNAALLVTFIETTTSTSGLSTSGDAAHLVTVDLTYGDAPDSGTAPDGTGTNDYGTDLGDSPSGARASQLNNEVWLGTSGSPTQRGQGNMANGTPGDITDTALANSSASDLTTYLYSGGTAAGSDPSEGVVGLTTNTAVTDWQPLEVGQTTYSVTVSVVNNTAAAATLIGWIDFNGDGKFEVDEAATATIAPGQTTATLTWTLPEGEDLVAGTITYARFRIATASETPAWTATLPSGTSVDPRSYGPTMNGDIEDYAIEILPQDDNPPDVTFGAITPDPRSTAVDSDTVTFTSSSTSTLGLAMNVTGVTASDFDLVETTSDGTTVTTNLGDASGVSVTGSGSTYTISGLSSLTNQEGSYTLELVPNAAITDSVGVAVNASGYETPATFTVVTTAPVIDLAPAGSDAPNHATTVDSGNNAYLSDVLSNNDAATVVDSTMDGSGEITSLGLQVSGVQDGTAETLTFGGSTAVDGNASAQTVAINGSGTLTDVTVGGVAVNITYAAGAFTLTPTAGGTLTSAQASAILNDITYQDSATYDGISDVTSGTRTIAVTATNLAGIESSPVTASLDVTNTTAAPAPVITNVSDSVDASGTWESGMTTPTISGTAEPGSTVVVAVNGTDVGTATVNADGAWSIADTTVPLPSDGSAVSITATATNASGTASPAASTQAEYNDSVSVVPTLQGYEPSQDANGADTNGSNEVAPASVASLVSPAATITLDFNEPIEASSSGGTITLTDTANGDAITLSFNGSGVGTGVQISGDQIILTPTQYLDAGTTYAVTISAGALQDVAGNAYVPAPVSTTASNVTHQTGEFFFTTATPEPPQITDITTSAGADVAAGGVLNSPDVTGGVKVDVSLADTDALAGDTLALNWGGQTVDHGLSAADIANGYALVTVPQSDISAGTNIPVTADIYYGAEGHTDVTDGTTSASSANYPVNVDLVNPTVNALTTNDVTPTLTGTATAPVGETLSVTLNGTTYSLPIDSATEQANGTYETTTAAAGGGTLSYDPSADTWSLVVPASADLGQNVYPVTVAVTDAEGSANTGSNSLDVVTIPPDAPVVFPDSTEVSTIATEADTTISYPYTEYSNNTDDTNDTQPLIVGAAVIASGDTLTVTVDPVGDTNGSEAVTYTEGDGSLSREGDVWSLTPSVLAQGTYTITATVHDAAGNATSSTGTLIVDTTPPAAPTVSINDTNGAGYLDAAGISSGDATVTVALVENASNPANDAAVGDVITLTSVDNGVTTTYTSAPLTQSDLSTGSITFSVPVANGDTLSETATEQDAAGNVSVDSNTATATVDTTAPVLSSYSPSQSSEGTNYSYAPTTEATAVATSSDIVLTFSESVSGVAGKTITLSDGSGTQTWTIGDPGVVVSGDTVTITPSSPLDPAATYTATISAGSLVDVAGNVNAASSVGFLTVTTVPPVITEVEANATSADVAENGVINAAAAADGTTVDVSLAGTGAVAGETLYVNWGEQQVAYTLQSSDITAGTAAVVIPESDIAAQGDGSVSITAKVGTSGQESNDYPVAVDQTLPTAPTVNSLDINSATPTLTGTATVPTGDTLSVTVDGTTYSLPVGEATQQPGGITYETTTAGGTLTYDSSTGSWSLAVPASAGLVQNDYPVTATVTDPNGNASLGTGSLDVVLTPPVAPTVNPLDTNDTTPTLTGTVTIAAGDSLTVTVDGVTYTEGDGALTVSGSTWSLAIPSNDALPQATYTVTATTHDDAGNATNGTGTLIIDTTPPSAPTVTITTDANQNGYLSASEVGDSTTAAVQVGLPTGTVAGDVVTLTSDGVSTQYTVTTQEVQSGYIDATVALPANGQTLSESATITDVAGNVSGPGTASAIVDTTVPSAPTVTITTDSNQNGYLSASEVGDSTTAAVRVGLPTGTVAGDVVTLTSDGVSTQYTVTTQEVQSGYIDATVALPANGQTLSESATIADVAGNVSGPGTASAIVDTTIPVAPTVTITTDSNQNGYLSASEVGDSTTAAVQVGLPAGAVAGDVVTLTSDGVSTQYTVTTPEVQSGYIDATVALPANGQTLSESATIADVAGNVSGPGTASAIVDTTIPPTPTVTITTDANQNGYLSASEVGDSTTAAVQVGLPAGAVAGDVVTLTSDGVSTQYTVTTQEVQSGYIDATVALPANGQTLSESATIADVAGNVSGPGTASAIVDTTIPVAPTVTITTDSNQNGYLSASEVGDSTTAAVQVGLPAGAVAGDVVTLTSDGVSTQYTVTTPEVQSGYIDATVALPANGQTLSESATIADVAGNVSGPGTASAIVDTTIPSAPTVTVTTDSNQNGYLSASEVGDSTTAAVRVGLPTGTVAGDVVTLTSDGVSTQYTVTTQEVQSGYIDATVALPANGQTLSESATIADVGGNVSGPGTASAIVDTTIPPTPTVTITTDANQNGYLSASEVGDSTTAAVQVGLPTGTVAGDVVTLTSNGVSTQYTVTTQEVQSGYIDATVALPANGQTLSESATIADVAGNVSGPGTASAIVDTTIPSAPTVTITTDANQNGYLSASEVGDSTTAAVQVGLPTGTVAGDVVTLTSDGVSTQYTVTTQEVQSGYIDATVALPANGQTLSESATITDVAGNVSGPGTASAIVDTTIPPTPTVTITTDANQNGYLSASEVGDSTTAAVQVGLPTGTVAGDVVTLTSNGVSTQYTVTTQEVQSGYIDATVALPANGQTLSESATITDVAGNVSGPGTASAIVDTTIPPTPTVTITTDANQNGYLSASEVGDSTTATVSVALPANAVVGDTITLTSNTGPTQTFTVTSQDLSAGHVIATEPLPAANGETLSVSATIADVAGNVSGPGTASATRETTPPLAPTVTGLTTTNVEPTISGTYDAADSAGGLSVTVNGKTYALGSNDPALTVSGNTWSLNLATAGQELAAGDTTTVTVVETDQAGNVASNTGSVQIIVVPPTQQRTAPESVVATNPWVAEPATSAVAPANAAADGNLPALAVGWSPSQISIPAYVADTRVYDVYTQGDQDSIRIPVIYSPDAQLVVFHGAPDQDFDAGSDVRFRLPGDAFVSTRQDAIVRLSAERADGGPLPSWLHFDPTTGEFTGKAPANAPPEVVVHVVARDSQGHEAAADFRLKLHGGIQAVKGRPGLTDKMRHAEARPGRQYGLAHTRVSTHA